MQPRGRREEKTSRKRLSRGSAPEVLVKCRGSWPSPCPLSPTSGVLSPPPSTGLWHTAASLQDRRGCCGKVAPNLFSARPGSCVSEFHSSFPEEFKCRGLPEASPSPSSEPHLPFAVSALGHLSFLQSSSLTSPSPCSPNLNAFLLLLLLSHSIMFFSFVAFIPICN